MDFWFVSFLFWWEREREREREEIINVGIARSSEKCVLRIMGVLLWVLALGVGFLMGDKRLFVQKVKNELI